MLASKNAYRKNYLGVWVKTLVSNLNNSNHYVLVYCDDCNKLYKIVWSNRKRKIANGGSDFCLSCSRKGVRNPQYGKDRRDLMLYAQSFIKQNSMQDRKHSAKSKEIMSKRRSEYLAKGGYKHSHNRGRGSWYTSTKSKELMYADSLLEKLRMTQLDLIDTIVIWTKIHDIKIPYTNVSGLKRYCVPDFLILLEDGMLCIEEVKGRMTENDSIKVEATKNWCKINNMGFRLIGVKDLNENREYSRFVKEDKTRR